MNGKFNVVTDITFHVRTLVMLSDFLKSHILHAPTNYSLHGIANSLPKKLWELPTPWLVVGATWEVV
jgi:hypothetical protein